MELFQEFDGLIFDCDGTLIDSMPLHYVAWKEVLLRHGVNFPEDLFYALGGVPANKVAQIAAEKVGVVIDGDTVGDEKEAYFLEIAGLIKPIPHVEPIVRHFFGKKPMAVATGGYREIIEITLRGAGLRDFFAATACADDVVNHKPHPDTYLLAAEKLGLDPRRCAAFEDTDIGMEAIAAAGMVGFDVRHAEFRPVLPKG
jgi:HAD superfamily hydrolase (TIGR01509 family)